jgi:hypothetical protein
VIPIYYDITQAQHEQLLKPLNPTRVAKRSQGGKSLSYLEAWDVKAHLNRIFGFTGWSWSVTDTQMVFEQTVLGKNGGEQWSVGWKVVGTLEVAGARYSEAAIGSSSQPSRGDAHDMAIKTAESDALKRAAINLGDQFGLSLYNNGSTKAVVGGTLYSPATRMEAIGTVQASLTALIEVPVEAAESHEEPSEAPQAESIDPEPAGPPSDSDGAGEWIERLKECIGEHDVAGVVKVKGEIAAAKAGGLTFQGVTLDKWADRAVVACGKGVAAEALGATEVAE